MFWQTDDQISTSRSKKARENGGNVNSFWTIAFAASDTGYP